MIPAEIKQEYLLDLARADGSRARIRTAKVKARVLVQAKMGRAWGYQIRRAIEAELDKIEGEIT